MKLVPPVTSGFNKIGLSSGVAKNKSGKVGSGKETLRLRASGPATKEVADEIVDLAIEKINAKLEEYMGINDAELAQTVWEYGRAEDNPYEFTTKIKDSDLALLGFTDDFIYDLWGACDDAKKGRLKCAASDLPPAVKEFNEKY